MARMGLLVRLAARLGNRRRIARFSTSSRYWEERYQIGRDSGTGSRGRLAFFKANVVNDLVREEAIHTGIEFGCGDGQQLSLLEIDRYTGLDVSKQSIKLCLEKFEQDRSKSFFLYYPQTFRDNASIFRAELALSLDVIFHLVEDDIFDLYMRHLFDSASKHVCIYSSAFDGASREPHVRHRDFRQWIAREASGWELTKKIANPYPYDPQDEQNTSFADFYIYSLPLAQPLSYEATESSLRSAERTSDTLSPHLRDAHL